MTPEGEREHLQRVTEGAPFSLHLGDEVARIAEEGGYRYSIFDKALRWTPGARGIELDLDLELPVDDPEKTRAPHKHNGLALVVHDWTLALPDPTWFLIHAAIGDEHRERYASAHDELRSAFAPSGKVSDFAGLCALREAIVWQLRREEVSVQDALRACRSRFAVLYVEARHLFDRLPAEEQHEKRALFQTLGASWLRFIGGDSLIWIMQPSRGLPSWFSTFPRELIEAQTEEMKAAIEWRDRIIADVMPLEFRRHASEVLLARGMLGEAVEPWGEADASALRGVENRARAAKGRTTWPLYDDTIREALEAIVESKERLLRTEQASRVAAELERKHGDEIRQRGSDPSQFNTDRLREAEARIYGREGKRLAFSAFRADRNA